MTPAPSACITVANLPRYSLPDLVAAPATVVPRLGPSALLPFGGLYGSLAGREHSYTAW